MHLVIALHSHVPFPSVVAATPEADSLCEVVVDTYLPLLELLYGLEVDQIPIPVTLGITPVLANRLADGSFAPRLEAFLARRLGACGDAAAALAASGRSALVPFTEYWRGRLARLGRLFHRVDGDLVRAFRHYAAAGHIEVMSSAATYAVLPLLARDESVRLQLLLGRAEHERLFGVAPAGCWIPECGYRPRGPWQPHPMAQRVAHRPGIDELLGEAGYRYFFADAPAAEAGRPLGLYQRRGFEDAAPVAPAEQLERPPARSPYRGYQVPPAADGPGLTALVRDPRSSGRVWEREHGFRGDRRYLAHADAREPGGLELWRATLEPGADSGGEPYDPNAARALAYRHAHEFADLVREIAETEGAAGGEVIVAPFRTELFGHWWAEGVDFLGDVYRALARRDAPRPVTASEHLGRHPASEAVDLQAGSWGAGGDFSTWLNPRTEAAWRQLWGLEDRFWLAVNGELARPETHFVLAQAARELLLAQASDWPVLVSGSGGDTAGSRFATHVAVCHRLLAAAETNGPALAAAQEEAQSRAGLHPLFPDVLSVVARAAGRFPAPEATVS